MSLVLEALAALARDPFHMKANASLVHWAACPLTAAIKAQSRH